VIDETHDPGLKSWVRSANESDCAFPIQNLPLGVFRTASEKRARAGVAIGQFILDASEWIPGETLNWYLGLPAPQRRELRRELSKVLREGSPKRDLVRQSECEMLLPAAIGDYTDFYASIEHARNVGSMFRPESPLFPNYEHLPVAYHGRASSVVISGTPVRRPRGQLAQGIFGATKELDYELEIGAFIGPGNQMGLAIPMAEAEEHIAGLCLLNDWSARDIQRWEYQPLGPFLGKSFATSISPWMVTLEALEPFRVAAREHDAPLLPYLAVESPAAFDITVEVWLRPSGAEKSTRVSQSSFKNLYWTMSQMVAHHTSNGCPLRPGDLLGSGTVSGRDKENRGCLLELTWKGSDPLDLGGNQKRLFLEDGDEVILTGHCTANGFARIGLGECCGTILPALSGL